ncbi:sigma-70 family RNA polymerase sigma factor [Glycomyces algeriensis]|uniref:RNA polymerase sigma factor n=1 Tax=Glycomyces algeriensis TaxID=256037 RepID=A0A9W6G557_9ACTN|nr:sigma-70 family RNA polymerase sigma factor [Glycomyces algeriensis]MDA1368880.1 sigma-70 family RNA polymerase sigma factor [Glycomyces algeriensis]MDR7352847.1 RNA polymerase sigma-70 factor (ECF subfamily) [Glycomyces algeriensis]GLI40533.1 RNA polymerase sigma factor [Glycomyces algeriensis]
MAEEFFTAEAFEAHRTHLRAVAYRMLGSLSEAEDAVQEAWIKASRADTAGVENPAGWLTTVVSRVCLDMLRSRKARREDALDGQEAQVRLRPSVDPEAEAQLADAVGLAMLVVLDALSPVERLAFVLHDMFAVPFAEIAPIVERSPETTQRLASRARRRVHGKSSVDGDRLRRFQAVDAFLQASRDGEFGMLLSLLDPNVTMRLDDAARLLSARTAMTGATAVAEAFNGQAALARPVLIDGEPGIVFAPRGKVIMLFTVRFEGDRIAEIRAVADESALAAIELTVV